MVASPPINVINTRLNEVESTLGRSYLQSWPRYMTIVLENSCNIDCIHCYHERNDTNLLCDAEINAMLRREFQSIYPYLETLRIKGGEVFALKGFEDLLSDISSCVDHPLVSISTNATLISETWCQRLIDLPFKKVTVSLNAGTPETYERIRVSAKFDEVLGNIKRLQRLKREQRSWYPTLDASFVIMRSNFKEVPEFLELLLSLEIFEVSFQTLLYEEQNPSRSPELDKVEQIRNEEEIRELHDVLTKAVNQYGGMFDRMSWNGLKSLFAFLKLDSSFLDEYSKSLHPTNVCNNQRYRGCPQPPLISSVGLPELPAEYKELKANDQQCLNPWTTLLVFEDGDVSLCSLSEPVGNLYKTPLIEIWNSHQAVGKRSRILAGRYTQSGCSSIYCDWRDGKVCNPVDPAAWQELLALFRQLTASLTAVADDIVAPQIPSKLLKPIRRLISQKDARIHELESNLTYMWETNGVLHERGQQHINKLEDKIRLLEEHLKILHQTQKDQHPGCIEFSARRDLEGQVFCAKPYEMLEVHEGGKAFVCCPSWLSSSIGDLSECSVDDVWNSEFAMSIRQSILEGSFKFCDKGLCPHLENGSGPVGTLAVLAARGFSKRVIDDLRNHRLQLNHGPVSLNCCYDRSCTLICPSCRSGLIMYKGEGRRYIDGIQDKLRAKAMGDAEHIFITGSGDPFGSPTFRGWLRSMREEEVASLKNIHIHTNAQMCDEHMWGSLSEAARRKIHSMEISIDAASENTYLVNRYPGSWTTLRRNLAFISDLRADGVLDNLRISMVVQNNNFREMGSFIELAERYGFDSVFFSRILNWFPGDKKAEVLYREKAVHLPQHCNHRVFLQILQEIEESQTVKVDWGNLAVFRLPQKFGPITPVKGAKGFRDSTIKHLKNNDFANSKDNRLVSAVKRFKKILHGSLFL